MGAMGVLAGWLVVSEIRRARERNRKERAWEAEGLPPDLRPGGDPPG
ncbi:MAG: hypothetical protein JXB39_09555 [Deltaproteobacteria bacterium]|nr:hypothetical protein [Deltaproteobacteria bacterium]